jgi:hypothetical protein
VAVRPYPMSVRATLVGSHHFHGIPTTLRDSVAGPVALCFGSH